MSAREGHREPDEFAQTIGLDLDPVLVLTALTHRSYAYEHGGLAHNERLEFLGDAVLELVVTEFLFAEHPDKPEGDLAKIRAGLVNTYVLADVARGWGPHGLGAYLRLGRGEELTGGRDKHSILADATEAVFGAVYVARGVEDARRLILEVMGTRMFDTPTRGVALDWKTSLQEKCAQLSEAKPTYVVTDTGPDHDKTFTAVAMVGQRELGHGAGRTKKEAEQRAAEQAWAALDAPAG